MILHNDFTVTFVILTFANVFLTTSKASIRWGISIYTFLFQLFLGMLLRWNHVLTDTGWNSAMEVGDDRNCNGLYIAYGEPLSTNGI